MEHRDPRGRDGEREDGRSGRRPGGFEAGGLLTVGAGERPKVVVTGLGPVTPVGIGVDAFWTGLTSGRNGVRTITRFPIDDLPVTVAGEVDGFEPGDFLEPKEARRTDRFSQFGIAAAKLAWEDAGSPDVVAERGGVIFATGIGGIETLLTQYDVLRERGPGRVSPFMVPMLMANAPAGHIAMRFGLTGANVATISACSSSNHAIWEAMRLLREGTLDLCIAGGSESA
ncbi:MAG: beta-ketoacyl-[acyl-carrier-protein] synthase family protein, partial [Actinomycetota bacterium]